MIQVLVADDSPTVRLMLRNWLATEDYEVLEAGDGQKALEAIRASKGPLVVLLDYEMPKMTGYEVLQAARDAGLLPPRYAYVIISGLTNIFPDGFSDLLRRLGIQILPKPFDQGSLLAVTAFVAARLIAGTQPTV
jgi:CheY-like chemotaxis protein